MLVRAFPFPRVIHFLIELSVLEWPLVGRLIRHLPVVVIDQKSPKRALMIAAKALKAGKSIAIFPEGKLTEDGELNAFLPGVFLIQSLVPEVPVLPFALEGGFQAWPYGGWPRCRRVAVHFGEPQAYDSQRSHTEKAQALQDTVRELLVTRAS